MRRAAISLVLLAVATGVVMPIDVGLANSVPGGTTVRVSLDAAGDESVEDSWRPALSADGRYIAFTSYAVLSSDDVGWSADVYVRDTATRETDLVSLAPSGEKLRRDSYLLGMSSDGNLVFFGTLASDYESVAVYLHDRGTGLTRRLVSNVRGGTPSGDGRWFVYTRLDVTGERARVRCLEVRTGTDTLVAGSLGGDDVTADVADTGDVTLATPRSLAEKDVDDRWDVYLWKRATGTFKVLSTRVDGAPLLGALWPSITANGDASAFFAGSPRWSGAAIVVWERGEGVSFVTKVSYNEFVPFQLDLTSDARFVVFVDGESDEHGDTSIRLIDRTSGARERIDVNDFGSPSENDARPTTPTVTPDGRFVAFADDSSQMVPSDANGRYDVFLRDRAGAPAATGAPDLWAHASGEGWWAGSEGIDPQRDQGYTDLNLVRGEGGSYAIRIYNAGNSRDRFSLTGKGSNSWSGVRYVTMDQDVTAQVLDGTFLTRSLRPGDRQVVTMEVTIEPTADRCDSRTMYLRTRSRETPAWLDLVQVGISVSCARRFDVDRSDDLRAIPAWEVSRPLPG